MDYTSVPNFMKIRRGRDLFLLIWHGMTHRRKADVNLVEISEGISDLL